MARKSKGKFNMKGHSIPGIKGCKTTTLEDGRAASSAFQMQSPLHEEGDGSDAYELDDINVESSDYDPNRATVQRADQSGVNYALQQLGRLAGRLKDENAAKEDKITEKINEYEVTGDAVDTTNPEFQSSIDDQFLTDEELAKRNVDKMDEELQLNAPKANLDKEITSPKVIMSSMEPDFSAFESVNDLVAERKLWKKENPGVRFPGQDEINKRLKENPNKWD
tara:strand:+ start:1125 stop:1793 length:669 start_codon:yes stop_codon:yes gene_type:complete